MTCNPCNLTETQLTCNGALTGQPQPARQHEARRCIDVTPFPPIPTDKGARAIFLKGFTWGVGSILRVYFMNGTKSQHELVRTTITDQLVPFTNLVFTWSDVDSTINAYNSIVRVTFDKVGSWSVIGTYCLQVSPTKPTTNFEWLDEAVILHEFGHVVGMVHEHMNPNNSCLLWNKEVVYSIYGGAPNYWSRSQVDSQVFKTYSKEQINGSSYDPLSIMHYALDSKMLCNPCNVNLYEPNTRLSKNDKIWLSTVYPYEGGTKLPITDDPIKKSGSSFQLNSFIITLICLLFVLFVLIVVVV